jgi:hypothetical protein
MEVFVLSFVVFVLSGAALAVRVLFGKRPPARRLQGPDRIGDFEPCCGSCFCAGEGADTPDTRATRTRELACQPGPMTEWLIHHAEASWTSRVRQKTT